MEAWKRMVSLLLAAALLISVCPCRGAAEEPLLLEEAETEEMTEPSEALAPAEPSGESPEGSLLVQQGGCGDNLTWTLDDAGTLTISGTGPMYDYYSYYDEWMGQCAPWRYCDVRTLVLEEGITSIGSYAFAGCDDLSGQLTLPSTLNRIGESAFDQCGFTGEVTVPAGVTSMEGSALSGLSGITGITFCPETPPMYSFYDWGLTALETISVPAGAYSAYAKLLAGNLPQGAKLKAIGATEEFLLDGTALVAYNGSGGDVVIPEGVTKIGPAAFTGCAEVTSLTIPEGVTEIERYAFQGCTGVTELTIPAGVQTIGYGAFLYMSNVTDVTFAGATPPKAVSNAWGGMTSLETIDVPSAAYSQYARVLANYYSGSARMTSRDFTGEFLLQGDTMAAYFGTDSRVALPEGITKIGCGAFWNCKNLTELTIPQSLTEIEDYALKGCTGLTELTVPAGVLSVGNSAFSGMSQLEAITFAGVKPPSFAGSMSGMTALKTIYVPGEAIGGYITVLKSVFSSDVRILSLDNTTEFYIEDGVLVSYLGSGGDVTIPDTVTAIGKDAFRSCAELTSITIPGSVLSIGDYAFYQCRNLAGPLTIPDTVTTIGSCAFAYCTGLTLNVESLPEGSLFVRAIAEDAAGNRSDSSDSAPFVQHIIDRTPPAAPQQVRAVSHTGCIEVAWAQGAESDLGAYSVYRADSAEGPFALLAGNLSSLNFIDRTVAQGQTCCYTVTVRDRAGNESEHSAVVSAQTAADTQPPVIVSLYGQRGRQRIRH